MVEIFIGELISSCVQNFIYDISASASKGFIKRYKQKQFFKRAKGKISTFCLNNESLYINGKTFQSFIKNHKPFERVMENALSIGESLPIEQLASNLIAEAEESAKSSGIVLSVDDRRILKDLLTLISNEITGYFDNVLDDSQKYLVSQNAQKTKLLQRDIKNVGDGNNEKIESLRKLLREATSISAYKAEPIAELICKKMWLGEFDVVETICQLVSAKSNDLELAIRVLKLEMLENRHEVDYLKASISHIENVKIRNVLIRNLIPLMYFRKEKLAVIGDCTDSEYLRTIMTALDNEDYSYLFSVETAVENGIELHKYTLNKTVRDAEPWLVDQIFAIYLYTMKPFNAASLIENTIDSKASWLSALITYDRKTDFLAYTDEENDQFQNELSELEETLEKKRIIFDKLSDDIEAAFYALIIKISLINEKNGDEKIKSIPTKLLGMRPVKDFIMASEIERGTISFEEVYDFCEKADEYWLITNFVISLRGDAKNLINLIDSHKNLLSKSETIFFIYVEALAHLSRIEEAKANLLEYKTNYAGFYEFWNIYLNIDDSVKDEFVGLCKKHEIIYITGHDGFGLVKRLINFGEFQLAEFYNNILKTQKVNVKLSRKYDAYILRGNNKPIDALECFKEAFEDFSADLAIVKAILSISIKLKRKIDNKYIRTAEESNDSTLVALAGGAYARNGDFSAARRCNRKALFMSDDCGNLAFNQFLSLNLQDKLGEIISPISVEKNTSVVLMGGNRTCTYCVHGDMELPESPCTWHGDTHLYISDAAKLGIYRKRVGDEVTIDGLAYTIKSIEALEKYISRVCVESIVKNGSAKAIMTPAKEGHIDLETFINQIKEFMPDSADVIDVIRQYNNYEDAALPLYMIKQNAPYSQFVELIIEEPKSCIRELINDNLPVNDKYILSFTSMILLKMLNVSSQYLAEHNVFITESAVMQIEEDTSEMITHYANDNILSMSLYEGKPVKIVDDDSTKDKWLKESGELKDFVKGIPIISSRKDWNDSQYNQLEMTEILGMPDYDAISMGINDGYTVIGTEAVITALAMDKEIDADVISITNWLISINADACELIDIVKKLVARGCIYSLTKQMVLYILNIEGTLLGEDKKELLMSWDSLFEVYKSVDTRYRKYGIEALRSVYVSVLEEIDGQTLNPIVQIYLQRLLWLLKLKAITRINEKGELERVYYQVQDDNAEFERSIDVKIPEFEES